MKHNFNGRFEDIVLKPIEKETRNGWKKAYLSSNCCIIDKHAI